MKKQLKKLKIGEVFKKNGSEVLYVRDEYNRSLKRYEYYRYDDISAFRHGLGTLVVRVGFDY